jgi:soluble lytic murein transglycosylase-like protein
MPIKTVIAALAAVMLAAPETGFAGAPPGSEYRLQIATEDYRLRTDPAYQLSAEFRRPSPLKAAPASRPAPRAALLAAIASKPYAREIELAAEAASIDLALVHAVIQVESGYRHNAVSPKGALGLMQVMPGTAARYGVHAPRPTAMKNLDVGTRYLRDLMALFGDRLDLVLAAYNAGEHAVIRYAWKIPPYPETQGYVRAVMARYAELGGVTRQR